MKTMTLAEIKAMLIEERFCVLKYVRVKDEFRFAIPGVGPEHIQMLKKGEEAKSAAFCTVDYDAKTVVTKGDSMSLKMGPSDDDGALLLTLLFS